MSEEEGLRASGRRTSVAVLVSRPSHHHLLAWGSFLEESEEPNENRTLPGAPERLSGVGVGASVRAAVVSPTASCPHEFDWVASVLEFCM